MDKIIEELENCFIGHDEYILGLLAELKKSRDEEIKKLRDIKLFAFDDEIKDILGRPNFACGNIANLLRKTGQEIKNKAEDEQAAVIYWMLSMYLEHGKEWKQEGEAYLKEALKDGE